MLNLSLCPPSAAPPNSIIIYLKACLATAKLCLLLVLIDICFKKVPWCKELYRDIIDNMLIVYF